MKKNFTILKAVQYILKKYFFNSEKSDICHESKIVQNNKKENEEKEVEEYMKNYQSTTRWQTV